MTRERAEFVDQEIATTLLSRLDRRLIEIAERLARDVRANEMQSKEELHTSARVDVAQALAEFDRALCLAAEESERRILEKPKPQ